MFYRDCNAINVPSIDYKRTPHFIMRSGSVTIIGIPKIHYDNPAVDDHILSFEHFDLQLL